MGRESGYKEGWRANKNYQYLTNSWYDSEMEGNDTALLRMLGGIEFCEQGITFSVPFIPGGRYKPDLHYAQQPNRFKSIGTARKSLVLVEYKGWDDGSWRNEALRQFLEDQVNSASDFIVRAVWVMRDDKRPDKYKKDEDWEHGGIKVFDGKADDWQDGAISPCRNENCGHTYYAVKGRHECPYCGNKQTQMRTDKPNSRFMELWRDHVAKETCRRMDEAYKAGKRVRYKDVSDQVIKEFLEAFSMKGEHAFEPTTRPHVTELDGLDYKQLVRDAYDN